jgi:hypothetical protein
LRKKIGFAIGNGESREGLNLNIFRRYGPLYGCNAVYRDFKMNVLVACDGPMVEDIKESGYEDEAYFRVPGKKIFDRNGGGTIPDRGWSAGPTALLLLCQSGVDIIFLIGFDMYGNGNKINNVYKGTKCYPPVNNKAISNGQWIKQKAAIFREFPDVEFYRVGCMYDEFPRIWEGIKNISFITFDRMIMKIQEVQNEL